MRNDVEYIIDEPEEKKFNLRINGQYFQEHSVINENGEIINNKIKKLEFLEDLFSDEELDEKS